MKKYSYHIVAFLLFVSTLQAQDLNFGVKGGLNYSNVVGKATISDTHYKPSFHAGIFAEIPLKGKFSFHPEILYSSQGAKGTYELGDFFAEPSGNGYFKYRDTRNFISIPLVTRFNVSEKFSIEVGP